MQCTFLQSTIYSELGKYLFHGPFQIKKILKAVAFLLRIIKSRTLWWNVVLFVVIVKSIRGVLLGTKENTATRFINSHSLGRGRVVEINNIQLK